MSTPFTPILFTDRLILWHSVQPRPTQVSRSLTDRVQTVLSFGGLLSPYGLLTFHRPHPTRMCILLTDCMRTDLTFDGLYSAQRSFDGLYQFVCILNLSGSGNNSELNQSRWLQVQWLHKFAYLTIKNSNLHALHVHFSFLYISPLFWSFARHKIACCAVMWKTRAQDDKFLIFYCYLQTADIGLIPG